MPKKARHELVVPTKLAPVNGHSSGLSTIDVLDLVPEEQVWLDGLKSENTRRAYQQDITGFANVLGITNREQLYAANHKAVTYWQKYMREIDGLEPSTIRRKLSALSSLFTHLVEHRVARLNPVREIKRPELDRSEGKTLAFRRPGRFSTPQMRKRCWECGTEPSSRSGFRRDSAAKKLPPCRSSRCPA